jgi:hypothetical protein
MHSNRLKRREFITLFGGATAWPLAARAQPTERMRRVGVLMGIADDAESQSRVAAFRQALQALGWIKGDNVEFNYRVQPNQRPTLGLTGLLAPRQLPPLESTRPCPW